MYCITNKLLQNYYTVVLLAQKTSLPQLHTENVIGISAEALRNSISTW